MKIHKENGKFYRYINKNKIECLQSGYLLDCDGENFKVFFNKYFDLEKIKKNKKETDTACAKIMLKTFGYKPWMKNYIYRNGEEIEIKKIEEKVNKKLVTKEEKIQYKKERRKRKLLKKKGVIKK